PNPRANEIISDKISSICGGEGSLAKYADIAVKGSVEKIQTLAPQAFTSNGFTIQWDAPTKAKAEKGSKGANILLGAMAQHHSVTFEIYPATEGGTLRVIKVS